MRLPKRLPIYPFGDNEQLYFGWSNDVGMYWDGTNLIFNPLVGPNMTLHFAAADTSIYGGTTAGDDLHLYANTIDAQPYIWLAGGSDVYIVAKAARTTYFSFGVATGLQMTYAANVSTLRGGGAAGDDLTLDANTTDAGATINLEGGGDVALTPTAGSFVKFGTHVGTGDVVTNGHIIIEDSGGTQRKLMTTA